MNKNIGSNLFWIYFRESSTIFLKVIVLAILSRNVAISDFGLLAIASIFIRFFSIICLKTIDSYVIFVKEKEDFQEKLNSAFWLDVLLGITCFLFLILFLPYYLKAYDSVVIYKKLELVVIVLAIQIPLDSLYRVPDAILSKNFKLKQIQIRDTCIKTFTSLLSILMALNGNGIWSLVIPVICTSSLKVVTSYITNNWRPKLYINFKHFGEIIKYSISIIGANLTSLIINEGDTLIIGKFLGTELLGIYNFSWQTSNIVKRTISGGISGLSLPILSKSNHDFKKLTDDFIYISRIIVITSAPIIITIAILSDNLILSLYGEKWTKSIVPLLILSFTQLRLLSTSQIIFLNQSIGKPFINFKLNLYCAPLYLISIFFATRYGIICVALTGTIVRILFCIVSWKITANLLKENFYILIRKIYSPLKLAFTNGLLLLIIKLNLINFIKNDLMILISGTIISMVITFLLINFIFKDIKSDLIRSFKIILPRNIFNKILIK
ncbi:MAG: oligosaccharide flippase family protein [Prochlorococcus marinus CUG1435]|nr:oligosaccharide flippase family protein [Prochlorococcus marinus CUG1435]